MSRDITFTFHKVTEQRPPESKMYLAYTEYGSCITILYSVRHGAWNCTDLDEEPEMKIDYDDTYIVAWADISPIDNTLADWRNKNG